MAKKARKGSKLLTKAAKVGLSKPQSTRAKKYPQTKIEQLEFELMLTERAGDRSPHDTGWDMQAIRIKNQIDALKNK